jgi:hypothetical protein
MVKAGKFLEIIKKSIYRFSLFLFFLFFQSSLSIGYVPTKGILTPELFDSYKTGREVTAIFQNPAKLAKAKYQQFKTESNQGFFGYSDHTVSYIHPFSFGVVGGGYHVSGTTDIPEVDWERNKRPVQVGTFSDTYHSGNIGLGITMPNYAYAGVRGKVMNHSLFGRTGQLFSLDLGGLIEVSEYLWVGAYTRHLIGNHIDWGAYSESLARDIILETGINIPPFTTQLSKDLNYFRFSGEWAIHPRWSVVADGVFDSEVNYIRHSIGAIIDFNSFALSYIHLNYKETSFDINQNLLGVMFRR